MVKQGAERFVAKWIAEEEVEAGLRYAVECPNVTRRIKERIARSKRARTGSVVLADYPHRALTCVLRAMFGLQMPCCLSLALRLFALFLFRIFSFIEAAAFRSIVLRYTCRYLTTICVSFCCIYLLFLGTCCLFPSILYRCHFLFIWRARCMFSFRMVVFYLVTTGWIFASAYVTTQSINRPSLHAL